MGTAKTAGRTVGVLILAQMVAGVLVNLVLTAPLFGNGIVFLMLAPLGVSQLVLALWFIAKGFHGPAKTTEESDA